MKHEPRRYRRHHHNQNQGAGLDDQPGQGFRHPPRFQQTWQRTADEQQQRHRGKTDCHRHAIGAAHLFEQLHQCLIDPQTAGNRQAEKMLQLAGGNQQRRRRGKARHHRVGKKIGHPAHAQNARRQQHQPHQHRQNQGAGNIKRAAVRGDISQCRRHHQRGHRHGPDGQRPGRSEQGIDNRRNDRCIKPYFRRQARQQGIGHGLGDQQDRRNRAGNQIARQILPPVVEQPFGRRHIALQPEAAIACRIARAHVMVSPPRAGWPCALYLLHLPSARGTGHKCRFRKRRGISVRSPGESAHPPGGNIPSDRRGGFSPALPGAARQAAAKPLPAACRVLPPVRPRKFPPPSSDTASSIYVHCPENAKIHWLGGPIFAYTLNSYLLIYRDLNILATEFNRVISTPRRQMNTSDGSTQRAEQET